MSKKPNILLITTDEQRKDTLSCYGSKVINTSNLDALASESITFDNAYTVSPWCLPSRCAILTGLFPHNSGAYSNFRNCELNKGVPARNVVVTDEEIQIIRELNLLTLKPVIYAFNVSEEQLSSKEETIKKIQSLGINTNWLFFNAKLENDVLALSAQEQKEYLNQYGLEDTGLNRLIKKSYEILGLVSFLTAGVIEAKAWTITKGTLAPQAAGTIHTDFEKKFIKADIVTYDDFVACEGWVKARETGKVVSAGKDYMMKDGDVVEFKVGS